jgi:hypothetical protein
VRCTALVLTAAGFALAAPVARAQMVTGKDMPGYAAAFGLEPARQAEGWEVREVAVKVGGSEGANVLWPKETAVFTLRFTNKTDRPFTAAGRLEVIPYGTSVKPGDVWVPNVFRQKSLAGGNVPLKVSLPPRGAAEVTLTPPIPDRFGGYGLVANLGVKGRAFAATLVRVPKPEPGRVQFPTYALDLPWPGETSEAVTTLFERLGVKGCRMGAGYYPTTAADFEEHNRDFVQHLGWAQKHNITVMLTVGEDGAPMPLGRPRPWLDAKGVMLDTKSDYAWLPELDSDFEKWSRMTASRYGWPRGPVNAIELWNEPWEGISISGWGADMLRYREMYERMVKGIVAARASDGVRVLIGGACSSTNTRDKLFCDGTDRFLPYLDFVSIHYQPLSADPALEKKWVNRKSPYGPVRVWDTESWIANSEDRAAGVIASLGALGQCGTAGIYQGNVYTPEILSDRPRRGIAQAWAPAVAVAACQKFIGQRPFRRLLFTNGLPWVFAFGGLRGNDDAGTLVVLGDLGAVYDRSRTLFRSVPLARNGGSLTLPDDGGQFVLYDFYGNPVPSAGGKITVPLNGLGYFLRTNGARGSFTRLVAAVEKARITGYAPVEIVAHDLTAPVGEKPMLRLTLTTVYNRPIAGTLAVTLTALALRQTRDRIVLAPHETKQIVVPVVGGAAHPDNLYPLRVVFNADRDGTATHEENLRVNRIAKRTISIDGSLDDWNGVLPQPVLSEQAMGESLTEKAYLPFVSRDAAGNAPAAKVAAVGYVAADAEKFFFAARIADVTLYAGNVRFATRDDDQYFYPEKSYAKEAGGPDGSRSGPKPGEEKLKELDWPAGVRRFSSRKDPDLPSGNGTDGVQIAFNVLPTTRKSWLPYPPGTMPRFMVYEDTDYEFALNVVAPAYGGGTEIWCLQKPGMERKHFYPRQPRALGDGGPITDGKLVMKRDGNVRIIECGIPWSRMPEVKARLDAGQTIKFSFRVNDDKGPAYELAVGRSVSKENPRAFHNDWTTHWANELEFGADR